MDEVAMEMCNNHNNLDYEVAPTLFLEFHGTEESVKSQAAAVGKCATYLVSSTLIMHTTLCILYIYN